VHLFLMRELFFYECISIVIATITGSMLYLSY
jgi:hypothetical protein